MNKIKIGFDLDDVILDTLPSFLDFFNRKYKTNFKREDITSYHVWEVGIGKDKKEAINYFDEFYNFSEFGKIPLIDGAKEGVLELVQLSDSELYVVTSRPLRYRTKTFNSITKNFPEISFCIYYSNDFHKGTNNKKADICQRLDLDFYIEDCLAYAESCAKKRIKTFLLDKPWNQNGEIHKNIKRVYNWKEIVENIKNKTE